MGTVSVQELVQCTSTNAVRVYCFREERTDSANPWTPYSLHVRMTMTGDSQFTLHIDIETTAPQALAFATRGTGGAVAQAQWRSRGRS